MPESILRKLCAGSTVVVIAMFAAMRPCPAAITSSDRISVDGVGPVKFGMTLEEAAKAGAPLSAIDNAADAACFIARPASPAGLSFMVRDGKIVRADVVAPANLKTADGFGRGDQEPAILSFYAATKGGVSDFLISPNSEVSLLVAPQFSEGDDVPRLAYEAPVDGGVTAIHAGWLPQKFHGCAEPDASPSL